MREGTWPPAPPALLTPPPGRAGAPRATSASPGARQRPGPLRYVRDPEVFELELAALSRVWNSGHRNLHVTLPFVRTAAELRACRALIAGAGLIDRPGFELWITAEVPSVQFSLGEYARMGIAGIRGFSSSHRRTVLISTMTPGPDDGGVDSEAELRPRSA